MRGTDGAVWHKWQVTPSGGWSDWDSQGGVITSNIAVARNADGRLEMFVRGTDNALWHKWQTHPERRMVRLGDSRWCAYVRRRGRPKISDGRLEVFVRGTDGAVWHKWQVTPSGGWSDWASQGGVITSNISVGRSPGGRMEFFVRGTDGAVWHKWQVAPNSGWSDWASQGGVITSNIAVARNSDGRLEIFVRGTDNALWHDWQTHPFAERRAELEIRPVKRVRGGRRAVAPSYETYVPQEAASASALKAERGLEMPGGMMVTDEEMPKGEMRATPAAGMPRGAMRAVGTGMPKGYMRVSTKAPPSRAGAVKATVEIPKAEAGAAVVKVVSSAIPTAANGGKKPARTDGPTTTRAQ